MNARMKDPVTGDELSLGKNVPIPATPDKAVLDRVPAPDDNCVTSDGTPRYLVRLSCPEFTSLCPATGQPDFAQFIVDYAPGAYLVESKSFKLFMASFRNHAAFHESVTTFIGGRLYDTLQPIWMRVCGFWFPRGGIPIDIFWEAGEKPANLRLPAIDVPTYRGR